MKQSVAAELVSVNSVKSNDKIYNQGITYHQREEHL